MIKANDLTFGYKSGTVLRGVSLTLSEGELCSVIGANGSGKTTLIRLLARLSAPREGSIEIDGKSAADYTQKEYARKVSLLPQERTFPTVTVSDLIASGRYPYLGFSGKFGDSDIRALDRAVSLTGTEAFLSKKVTELSGGERQRVAFALLLAQDTPYILLDEPSTHLDLRGASETDRLIQSLKEDGKGILSVSHDLSSALKYSDKLLILDGGCVAFYGTPYGAIESGAIEKAFGVTCVKYTDGGETEYFFKKGRLPK